MLITFKVIILYIIQVIISMQTSVKMGNMNWRAEGDVVVVVSWLESSYMQK